MPKTKKAHIETPLDALPEEQQQRLTEWLAVDRLSCAAARARLKREYGVAVSLAALQSYSARHATPSHYSQERENVEMAGPLREGSFDVGMWMLVRHLAVAVMSRPRTDLASARTLLKLVDDVAEISLAERNFAFEERKLKALEATAARADKAKDGETGTPLADVERAERLRALFAMG